MMCGLPEECDCARGSVVLLYLPIEQVHAILVVSPTNAPILEFQALVGVPRNIVNEHSLVIVKEATELGPRYSLARYGVLIAIFPFKLHVLCSDIVAQA